MLNQVLLQGFNTYVDPLIEKLCGNSKAKELGVKIGVTALASGASYATFGSSELVAKLLHALSSTIFGSIITDYVNFGLKNVKDFIADKLDDYGYDKYMDIVDPFLDIGTGFALRQVAGSATSLPNITSWMGAKEVAGGNLQNSTAIPKVSSNESKGLFSKIFGGIGDTASAVFNLGKSTQYNEGNLVSNSLDMAGGSLILNGAMKGVISIFSGVWNLITGNDKSELSVYDIKNILKTQIPSEDYNRAEVKAQADQIFAKIQQSDKYVESFASKPEIQKNIEIVTGLYSKVIGVQLKAQYASALSDNPELFEKSEIFVDKLMETQVTSRLLGAREMFSKIAQLKEHGLEIPNQLKQVITEVAQQKLAQELNGFKNISGEEKVAYKSLFSKATEIEVEFQQLSYMMAIQQQAAEAAPEFA